MHDRYWRHLMQFAGNSEWSNLVAYVESHPWLATASMGPNVLPDYLAGEKAYGVLRLLCNIEDVPVAVVRRLIELGARDGSGRGYLERLLAGAEKLLLDQHYQSPAESPAVAALVLATCEDPKGVIERMHGVLGKGLQDADDGRRLLAERCIGRSGFFNRLLTLLYQVDRVDLLPNCLGDEHLLDELAAGRLATGEEVVARLAQE